MQISDVFAMKWPDKTAAAVDKTQLTRYSAGQKFTDLQSINLPGAISELIFDAEPGLSDGYR